MTTTLRVTWFAGDDGAELAAWSKRVTDAVGGTSAAYRLTGGGVDMDRLGAALTRVESTETRRPDWVLFSRFTSSRDLLQADPELRAVEDALPLAVVPRAAYVKFDEGPGSGLVLPDDEFGAAVQFGTFNMATPQDDLDLAHWYVTHRFPEFASITGTRRVSRWYSVWGPVKGAVFYEFDSLEDRLEHFEKPMETRAMDPSHPTGSIVSRTRHAWVSPSIGYQV